MKICDWVWMKQKEIFDQKKKKNSRLERKSFSFFPFVRV